MKNFRLLLNNEKLRLIWFDSFRNIFQITKAEKLLEESEVNCGKYDNG